MHAYISMMEHLGECILGETIQKNLTLQYWNKRTQTKTPSQPKTEARDSQSSGFHLQLVI